MNISTKIKNIQKLAKELFLEKDVPDYIMVAFDYLDSKSVCCKKNMWAATLMFEDVGDKHPYYIDDECSTRGYGETIAAALNDLENKLKIFHESLL